MKEIVELLVDAGADVNGGNSYSDDTPLKIALRSHNINLAQYLLGKPTNVN